MAKFSVHSKSTMKIPVALKSSSAEGLKLGFVGCTRWIELPYSATSMHGKDAHNAWTSANWQLLFYSSLSSVEPHWQIPVCHIFIAFTMWRTSPIASCAIASNSLCFQSNGAPLKWHISQWQLHVGATSCSTCPSNAVGSLAPRAWEWMQLQILGQAHANPVLMNLNHLLFFSVRQNLSTVWAMQWMQCIQSSSQWTRSDQELGPPPYMSLPMFKYNEQAETKISKTDLIGSWRGRCFIIEGSALIYFSHKCTQAASRTTRANCKPQ